ncbi:hypothetical protein G4V62_13310 [Bacillaceae bacterium SIJ1]|uniref:hypothetical protein n=1 Tax=Litoribacterium kuwaitense TaxID=1398745 RepID=UPI0013EA6F31|nr:hypothetical protein [Litoribacterium kuwaitense]NGP45878.1 hypothetical protein [Litoribacterium kuwaitense]
MWWFWMGALAWMGLGFSGNVQDMKGVELPPVRVLHVEDGAEEVWTNDQRIQKEGARMVASIKTHYEGTFVPPQSGMLVRIPYMPPIVLDGVPFDGAVSQVVLAIPEEAPSYLLLRDSEERWHVCSFSHPIDHLMIPTVGEAPLSSNTVP